jgi:hypothetical protein
MKTTISVRALTALLWLLTLSSHASAHELLVKWREPHDIALREAIRAQVGAVLKRDFSELGWELIEPPPSAPLASAIARLKESPAVAAVEGNSPISVDIPNPTPGRLSASFVRC